MTLRDRILTLKQHGGFDDNAIAAVLDVDIADLERGLTDPSFTPAGGSAGVTIPLPLNAASAADPVLQLGVTGELHDRLVIAADGSLRFSDGTDIPDVQLVHDVDNNGPGALGLYHSNALFSCWGGTVQSDASGSGGYALMAAGETSASVQVGHQPGGQGDATLFWSQGVGSVALTLEAGKDRSISEALSLWAQGDNYPSFRILWDGSLQWGSGSSLADVHLVHDSVREGAGWLGLYPINGSDPGFAIYGGTLAPDGSGTGPFVSFSDGGWELADESGVWLHASPTGILANPDGTGTNNVELNPIGGGWKIPQHGAGLELTSQDGTQTRRLLLANDGKLNVPAQFQLPIQLGEFIQLAKDTHDPLGFQSPEAFLGFFGEGGHGVTFWGRDRQPDGTGDGAWITLMGEATGFGGLQPVLVVGDSAGHPSFEIESGGAIAWRLGADQNPELNPTNRLKLDSPDSLLLEGAGAGLVLVSPDGNHTVKISIDNTGAIVGTPYP